MWICSWGSSASAFPQVMVKSFISRSACLKESMFSAVIWTITPSENISMKIIQMEAGAKLGREAAETQCLGPADPPIPNIGLAKPTDTKRCSL